MQTELYKEMLKALNNDTLYDFLANEAWRLSNEDAAYIAKEILWAYGEAIKNHVSIEEANKELAQNLKDYFE